MATITTAQLPTPKPDTKSIHPPKSKIGIFLWRRRVWFEATFVLSLLEPWEKVIFLTMFLFLLVLVFTGLYRFLPRHLVVMQRRAIYYLWGQEGDERLLWQWLGLGVNAGSGPGIHKEL